MGSVLRKSVYDVIDGEREYQERAWPTTTNGPEDHWHTVGEEIVLLNRYVQKATEEWSDKSGDEPALHVVRKIAAIAVRCMERHGAPPRA